MMQENTRQITDTLAVLVSGGNTDSSDLRPTMSERFAIYFAPATRSVLWKLASEWLGRNPAERDAIAQATPAGMDAETFRKITGSPRRYGFHATLKAPMRLAPGASEADLLTAAQSFAARRQPVELGHLEIRDLMGFIALMPGRQSPATAQFAADCVAHFEPLRALLTDEEREKRLKSGLTLRQTELLDQYGYPYVMEEFRFHMTLTDRLDPAIRTQCMEAASNWFGPALGEPVVMDRIAVCKEPAAGAPFIRLADFPLGGLD